MLSLASLSFGASGLERAVLVNASMHSFHMTGAWYDVANDEADAVSSLDDNDVMVDASVEDDAAATRYKSVSSSSNTLSFCGAGARPFRDENSLVDADADLGPKDAATVITKDFDSAVEGRL
jgi:hypothetical protein